jgi:hypothetical protein
MPAMVGIRLCREYEAHDPSPVVSEEEQFQFDYQERIKQDTRKVEVCF